MSDEKFKSVAEMEAATLEMLRDLNHTHLIRAIAYYTVRRKHYVMFPWAGKGNLRDLWSQDPPPLTEGYLKWVFAQLCGLADAISVLHHSNQEQHWRHGDLKPENILCFEDGVTDDGLCTLVIADVGLSKDHKAVTEVRIERTSTHSGTLMYEPPEARMLQDKPRSRRYDVWSLGCIYLEFLTWLLYGSAGLEDFRANLSRGENTRFYVIDPSQRSARLNTVVQQQIEHIQGDARCSDDTAILQLVDLIVNRLLVAEAADPSFTRTDSFFTKSDSDSSLSENPRFVLRSATLRPEHMESLSFSGRATAREMNMEMERIIRDADSGRLVWMRWDASAPEKMTPKLYAHNLAAPDPVSTMDRRKEIEVR